MTRTSPVRPAPRQRGAFRVGLGLLLFAILLAFAAVAAWRLRGGELVARAVAAALEDAGFAWSCRETVVDDALRVRFLEASLAGEGFRFGAEEVAVTPSFSYRSPYVTVGISATKAAVELVADESPKTSEGAPSSLPTPPPYLDSIRFEGLRVDLGAGRTVEASGELAVDGGAWTLAFAKGAFAEATGAIATEDLTGLITLGRPVSAPLLESDVAASTAVATAPAVTWSVTVVGGAALWNSVLVDFASHPLDAGGALSQPQPSLYRIESLRLDIGDLATLEGQLDVAGDGTPLRGTLRASSEHLGDAFAAFVRDPFAGVVPVFADAVVSGRAVAEIRFDAFERRHASLLCKVRSPRLEAAGLRLDDVTLELPYVGRRASGQRKGVLRAKSLYVGESLWGPVDVELIATPGRFRAGGPLVLRPFGATAELDAFALEDDGADETFATGRLDVRDLDLALVGRAFGYEAVTGSAGGSLAELRIDSDRVATRGSFELSVFGGRVTLSNLGVDDPFGRLPSLEVDADLESIDLEALTGAFPFGRVTGTLQGSIRKLVLVAGQAERFDADLRTVARKGVAQTIDVRALTQLGVLGGGDAGAMSGLVLKLFEKYRYTEMGLRCSLRNDRFELRGVRSEGGKQYLVKGSLLPPSVNVVSHSQIISFSEMLARVRRIAAIGGEGESTDEP